MRKKMDKTKSQSPDYNLKSTQSMQHSGSVGQMTTQKLFRHITEDTQFVDEIIEEESTYKAIGSKTQRFKKYNFQIDAFDGKITLERQITKPEFVLKQSTAQLLIQDPSIQCLTQCDS